MVCFLCVCVVCPCLFVCRFDALLESATAGDASGAFTSYEGLLLSLEGGWEAATGGALVNWMHGIGISLHA